MKIATITTVAVVVALLAVAVIATPLDDYVNKPDPNYKWSNTGITYRGAGWTGYVLNMTSQAWLTAADWGYANGLPGNLWYHFMLVVVPDKVYYPDAGFVWLTGSGNDPNGYPKNDTEDSFVTSTFAVNTGTIGAAVFQIPNEALVFFEEKPTPKRRTEDAIIAWTWKHFIEHPENPEWLLRLPMTKAAVRSMDTLSAFAQSIGRPAINRFIVAGASKRGWTTWTTAAVDKRVVAAIPLVMDELNFVKNIHHHYQAYGGWSFALKDYYDLNFTLLLDDPRTQKIFDIVDPIVYKDRLTMPKLVINAGGDEFFLPDDTRYWWDEMSDEKNFLMVPNAEHSLATGILEIIPAVEAFTNGVLQGMARPKFTWVHDDNAGTITVTNHSPNKPVNVTMWYAYSAKGTGRRDWRLVAGPNPHLQLIPWFPQSIQESPQGNVWVAHAPAVPKGQWVAFFVDMKYLGPKTPQYQTHFKSTTSVGITPNTFPFPPCSGTQCYGKLT